MKKIYLILALLTITIIGSFGQTSRDSIVMKKMLGGYMFYQGANRLKMYELVNVMKPNEKAYKEIKSAQSTYALTMIIGGTGGFMIGWPVGTAIAGGDPDWVMAGIGMGLIVISIPISQKYYKQAKQAVGTYNGGLQASSFWDKKELRFSMRGNGAGLIISF
jgi:hypothetical protein